jgi:hypothetical protein
VAASSAVYIALWGVYRWIPNMYGLEGPPYEVWTLLYIVPPMILVGGFTAYVTYDVEFGTGLVHYALYLAVTVLLSYLAGARFLA